MNITVYECNGIKYKIVPITDESYIADDMNAVAKNIQDTEPELYKLNMQKSVGQGLAFSVLKDDERVGFAYSYKDGLQYIGASVYIGRDIVSSVIGLLSIFHISDSHKIQFSPHTNGLKYFKSIVTGPSIRTYHATGKPLIIKRSDALIKGQKLFKYLGITNG